ncbi:AAA family ATPase [Streptomyces sp. NPDC017179]
MVLYGPPGTGKTYLATKLAEYFGGGPEQVKIVR